MARLPQPGADNGAWGHLLNSYLLHEHMPDGAHNISAILSVPLTSDMVLVSHSASAKGFAWMPKAHLQGEPGQPVQLQLTSTHLQWRLQGDLAWTDLVALTEITGPAGPEGQQGQTGSGVAEGGVAGQWLRKTGNANYQTEWGAISKQDVGLSNVDNTSDADKPISDATAMAIAHTQRQLTALALVL